jgi:hypothetical protein
MHRSFDAARFVGAVVVIVALSACAAKEQAAETQDSGTALTLASNSDAASATVVPVASTPEARLAQVMRGRLLTVTHGCAGCHGGGGNPNAEGFLAGVTSPIQEFKIGPCYLDPNAKPCFVTRPRNLTPDNTTGLGRFTERQIFNALRYGLRPGETPDVEITSSTPGEGNFPANPKYLAIPMPWPEWRHMPDQALWDIAAYLKHGLKPVVNKVKDSDGPPDFWASEYTVEKIGTYPMAAFPTSKEKQP